MAITPSDYNNIRDKVVLVMGTGATGYGQTLTSIAATTNNVISSSLWNGLRTDMIKARQHQTGVDESASLPVLTQTTIISETIRVQFDNFANLITTNKFTCAANQATVQVAATSTPYSASWNSNLYHQVVLTFSSNLQARYFFNAGGEVRFRSTRSGVASNTKDTEWSLLLGDGTSGASTSGFGTLFVRHNTAGTISGSNATGRAATTASVGFYQLTTSNQTIATASNALGSYNANNYTIRVRANDAVSPSVITFTMQWNDAAAGIVDELVTGQVDSFVTLFRPSGSNVSVSAPTVSQTSLQLGVLS